MRLRRFYTMDDRIIDETTNIISLQHNEDQILDLSTGNKHKNIYISFNNFFFYRIKYVNYKAYDAKKFNVI